MRTRRNGSVGSEFYKMIWRQFGSIVVSNPTEQVSMSKANARICFLKLAVILVVLIAPVSKQVAAAPEPPIYYFEYKADIPDVAAVRYFVTTAGEPESDAPVTTVLQFPTGRQDYEKANALAQLHVARLGALRGYQVITPIADEPPSPAYYDNLYPQFLDYIIDRHNVEGGKFHFMGASTGGIASLYVAARAPEYVKSVSAYPGYVVSKDDSLPYEELSILCVYTYVGERDIGFIKRQRKDARAINKAGGNLKFKVYWGDGHNLEILKSDRAGVLYRNIDRGRGCPKN